MVLSRDGRSSRDGDSGCYTCRCRVTNDPNKRGFGTITDYHPVSLPRGSGSGIQKRHGKLAPSLLRDVWGSLERREQLACSLAPSPLGHTGASRGHRRGLGPLKVQVRSRPSITAAVLSQSRPSEAHPDSNGKCQTALHAQPPSASGEVAVCDEQPQCWDSQSRPAAAGPGPRPGLLRGLLFPASGRLQKGMSP